MTSPNENILAGRSLDHARALARKAWEAELEARDLMTVRSSAITKIVRHLERKAKADAPALTAEERAEVEADIAYLNSIFPTLGLAAKPPRQRLEAWMSLRRLGRGKRGTGAKELRPGIGAAAFALLNWRHAQGEPITARLETIFPKDGSMPEGAVPWTFLNTKGEEVERLYLPSKAVRWLASELCLLDPALSGATSRGRRPDWHLAYECIQRWREWRGLTKGSR